MTGPLFASRSAIVCAVVPRRLESGGRSIALASVLLGSVCLTGCINKLTGTAQQPALGASTGPKVGVAAGLPITPATSTGRLPSPREGRELLPVAATAAGVLVADVPVGAPSAAASYALWDPASGALSPVSSWRTDESSVERILGASGDWIVVSQTPLSASGPSRLFLRDLRTGEDRELGSSGDGNTEPRVAVADGWVAWAAAGPSRPGLHVYNVAAGSDTVVSQRARGIGSLAVGNGVVAWWGSFGTQAPRIIVHNLADQKFDSVQASSVGALALSGDGSVLAWIQTAAGSDPGLFVHELSSGTGGRLLGGPTVGVALSSSGPFLAWQPQAGGTAGIYNMQTHELRLVQNPSGGVPRVAQLLGPWFAWSDGTRQAGTPAPAAAAGTSPLGRCCYFLRLHS